MKFHEPKTKSGKPLLGVTLTYNEHSHTFKWFVNGEKAYVKKVCSLLGYSSPSMLHTGIRHYGINLMMMKGLDKCREMAKEKINNN